MKHGTWALGPLLVTPTSHWQKELIALLANPCWGHHSKRAETILTPNQVQDWISSMAKGGWRQEVLDLMAQGFQSVEVMQRLYPVNMVTPEVHAARIQIHFDFLTKLMAKRASSLAYTYLRPPLRYSALLDPAHESETQAWVKKEWDALLELEAKHAAGSHVHGLGNLHFLQSCFARLSYHLNEADVLTGAKECQVILKSACCHFGDTACIESSHFKGCQI